jgi:hypothetical protein
VRPFADGDKRRIDPARPEAFHASAGERRHGVVTLPAAKISAVRSASEK